MNTYCFGCEDYRAESCPRVGMRQSALETTVQIGAGSLGVGLALVESINFASSGSIGSTLAFSKVREISSTRKVRKLAVDFCVEAHLFTEGYFDSVPAPADIVPPSEN